VITLNNNAQPAAIRRTVRNEIEYAVVALELSQKQIAEVVREATGVVLDTPSPDLLQLNESQLEAIWQRLSNNPKWKRPHD
jgi:hypothetical protein